MCIILEQIKNIVWGLPTLALLLVCGIYFTHKSRFYRPKAFISVFRDTFKSLKVKGNDGISPFAAIATALGGTVGVGSIVGVGYAVSVGGAGSIFWMWVCSFFGMGLKYAEVETALKKRDKTSGKALGGAHIRLMGLGYRKTAFIFCIFCVLASFGTGNITQVGAISSFLQEMGVAKPFCAVICVAVIATAVFGGRGRIAKTNTFIVPTASVIYIFACVAILIINYRSILPSFQLILGQAFGFDACLGGFSGAVLARVLREGFVRSMFSNEAGMGSSPLAHATAEQTAPKLQAKWVIFEIFFDTFIVSTLTALCLLSSNSDMPSNMFFNMFGNIGKTVFGMLTAVFAFASVISWCYYAECCISFMFPNKNAPLWIYRVAFSLFDVCGVFVSGGKIWELEDILNAFMMFPNLFLLFKCRKEIERIV